MFEITLYYGGHTSPENITNFPHNTYSVDYKGTFILLRISFSSSYFEENNPMIL